MSDLVGNPEDRFSRVEAHGHIWTVILTILFQGKLGVGVNQYFILIVYCPLFKLLLVNCGRKSIDMETSYYGRTSSLGCLYL